MSGLHRFKLHRHLVDGTVKSVWLRQVFGLLGVRFRQISLYKVYCIIVSYLFVLIISGLPLSSCCDGSLLWSCDS